MSSGSEAFSRVLIDRALTDSGWDLLSPRQVRFETRAGGRADYVLLDDKGMALCVLEAKREDHDPYDAKEQGRGYAENLHAPFILLSNGREHWFWNYQRADQQDAYRVERLPSPEDLDAAQRTLGCWNARCRQSESRVEIYSRISYASTGSCRATPHRRLPRRLANQSG